MTVNPATAANLYSSAAGLTGGPSGEPKVSSAPPGADSFSNLVTQALGDVSESGQSLEASAANLVDGKADIVDLVTAVAETELALETLVTVRDRVISAYQDILNMPI